VRVNINTLIMKDSWSPCIRDLTQTEIDMAMDNILIIGLISISLLTFKMEKLSKITILFTP
jgi:hypothetical protein